MDQVPALTAEFALHGGEGTFHNTLTNSTDVGAEIWGHFFDSAAQAETKGWSQEDHDMVVQTLDRLCAQTPEYVWEVTHAKAAAPWPTYDATHHNTIATLAETLGLAVEALAYEQQEKNRPAVVEKLTELVGRLQEQDDAADLLTAA